MDRLLHRHGARRSDDFAAAVWLFRDQNCRGLAWLAVFSSALLFAIRLVNAPILLWLELMPLLKIVVIISLIAAFMIASDRKIDTARICAHEIYGSGSKATTYQLGGCIALFAGLWLLTVHASP